MKSLETWILENTIAPVSEKSWLLWEEQEHAVAISSHASDYDCFPPVREQSFMGITAQDLILSSCNLLLSFQLAPTVSLSYSSQLCLHRMIMVLNIHRIDLPCCAHNYADSQYYLYALEVLFKQQYPILSM